MMIKKQMEAIIYRGVCFLCTLFVCHLASAQTTGRHLFTTMVNDATFSSPVHQWTLQQVEYYNDCTVCRFCVKSLEAGVYLRLLPGCHIVDEEGTRFEVQESDLSSAVPGYKFANAGETLSFYLKFPKMSKHAYRMKLVLPELKVFKDIQIGHGSSQSYHRNPYLAKSSKANFWISGIDITDTKTSVVFGYDNTKATMPGYWDYASIAKSAALRCNGRMYRLLPGNEKYFTFRKKTKITFTCEFEPIPQNATQIDFIETGSSSFNIYGIELPFKESDSFE